MNRFCFAAWPFALLLFACGARPSSGASTAAPPPPPPAPVGAGAAAAPPAEASAASSAPTSGIPRAVNEAADRVRAAIASPDDAHITATFSPTFLAQVPASKLREIFTAVRSQAGDCSRQELVEKKTEQQAVLRLVCANGNILGAFTVNEEPAHLIDGLLIKPEPR